MPLCWLPYVTKLRTLKPSQRSTRPRRNCPPWEKPKASTLTTPWAFVRFGFIRSSSQITSDCAVIFPKKVARWSSDPDSAARMYSTCVPGWIFWARLPTLCRPSASWRSPRPCQIRRGRGLEWCCWVGGGVGFCVVGMAAARGKRVRAGWRRRMARVCLMGLNVGQDRLMLRPDRRV